jgi:hypothetical protein
MADCGWAVKKKSRPYFASPFAKASVYAKADVCGQPLFWASIPVPFSALFAILRRLFPPITTLFRRKIVFSTVFAKNFCSERQILSF